MSVEVSVIVPAYNCETYLAEALESVLVQTGADAEVLVVDDGSTDGTASVAGTFGSRVRVLRLPHGGIAATFNHGVREARGRLIASCDSDDRWLPGKLMLQRAALEADPSIDAVFGHVRRFVSPDFTGAIAEMPDTPVPGIHRGVMLLRREAWSRVGEMEARFTITDFVSWYPRAMDAGLKTLMLPEVLYERRIHDRNSVVLGRDVLERDYLRIVRDTLQRRRRIET